MSGVARAECAASTHVGICPGCSLIVRPIFAANSSAGPYLPDATPDELAAAVVECVAAGARVLNLSVGLSAGSPRAFRGLEDALDHAGRSGVVVAAAAGNQGSVGSSLITRHPAVIPVAACDARGGPFDSPTWGRRSVGAAS